MKCYYCQQGRDPQEVHKRCQKVADTIEKYPFKKLIFREQYRPRPRKDI